MKIWIFAFVVFVLAIFCIKKYGWRYAGINELKALQKRIDVLEKDALRYSQLEKIEENAYGFNMPVVRFPQTPEDKRQ